MWIATSELVKYTLWIMMHSIHDNIKTEFIEIDAKV